MTLVEHDVDLTADEAGELVDRIRQLTTVTWSAVVRLYQGRGWLALGYESWDECCDAEFDGARIKLPREDRREVVASMADQGMSNRAIAAAIGVSEPTVRRDQGASNDAPDPKVAAINAELQTHANEQQAHHSKPAPEPKVGPAWSDEWSEDDEILDAEIIDEPAPRTVQGIDGKTYTKPTPTADQQREADEREADARYARNIERCISSWPYLLGTLDHPRRTHIIERLSEPDREQLKAIEGMIQ